jgi:hypothetical protein
LGWDHLNGPAPVALVARALEEAYGRDDFMPACLTVDLFKAARGVETAATTRLVRDGRRAPARAAVVELIAPHLQIRGSTGPA